jgi:hypothetical protein
MRLLSPNADVKLHAHSHRHATASTCNMSQWVSLVEPCAIGHTFPLLCMDSMPSLSSVGLPPLSPIIATAIYRCPCVPNINLIHTVLFSWTDDTNTTAACKPSFVPLSTLVYVLNFYFRPGHALLFFASQDLALLWPVKASRCLYTGLLA